MFLQYKINIEINIYYCKLMIFLHSCQPIFGAYSHWCPIVQGGRLHPLFCQKWILLHPLVKDQLPPVYCQSLAQSAGDEEEFVFLHQFERYPGCFATKAAAVAKLADLANKILSSEVVMNSEVQVLGVLEHMPTSMELEGDMEQLPTFSSCPVVQILVCIKEPFGKVHSSAWAVRKVPTLSKCLMSWLRA